MSMLDIFRYAGSNPLIDISLAILLLGATYTDVRWGKVPNRLTFPLILCGIILQGTLEFPIGLGKSLAGILTAFLLLLVPFALYWLRGGDVKTFMAVGALTGPHFTLIATIFSAVIGGVLAVGFMLKRGVFKEKISFVWKSFILGNLFKANPVETQTDSLFPYVPAILVGTVCAYFELNFGPYLLR